MSPAAAGVNAAPVPASSSSCLCPCGARRSAYLWFTCSPRARKRWRCGVRKPAGADADLLHSSRAAQRVVVAERLADGLAEPSPSPPASSQFASYQDDPFVDKLRTQLGVIHPIPSPPINRNVVGFFVLFFLSGVVFDKLWTGRKRQREGERPRVSTSLSLFLEKDLRRKESVEWVNMVLGKLWKVYRAGIEDWIVGLLQPVIDDIKKPDYVQRVEIKQFSLGDEPLSVRNVERRTSRRVNDLQYQIGIRYTGGAWMALSLSLKFSAVPVIVPVWVRDFDIDGELWVKLRLTTAEPWVGAASWAFVSLPKIKFELSLFRLFNLMAIPVLSMFLTKLLTEDLPLLFVRPKKIVLDFQKGKSLGPVAEDLVASVIQDGNEDCVGELSVTLVDARKLNYVFRGKTDPYVIMTLGDQVLRSKKNSQTTIIGPPGEPIWNQDFCLLVTSQKKQRLSIEVKDSFGFADFTIGSGEVELGSLQDTVPTDKIIYLQRAWGPFGKKVSGELLLRLTYKAYVEDEDDGAEPDFSEYTSDDDVLEYAEAANAVLKNDLVGKERETFMDLLAALLVSEEFQGIMSSEETGSQKISNVGRDNNPKESRATDVGGIAVGSETASSSSGDSALIWFAAVTSVAVLIALNIGGSNIFNP